MELKQVKMSLELENKPEIQQAKSMSKCRIMKNLIVVCLGFFFLFCAFQSLSNLQTTINSEGSMFQSVVYVAFAASSLLLPKLMISKLGCKTTLVISVAAYIPFMASNYHKNLLIQLLTSILAGFGGGTLWSSGCTYINEISALYSSQDTETVDIVTTRFFGLFFMIFQNSQIWGNLASFYVLKPSTAETKNLIPTADNISATFIANTTITCGINFCGDIHQNATHLTQFLLTDNKRFILITVYLAFTILATIVIAVFLDSVQRSVSDEESNLLLSKLTATVKHLRKVNQLLLVPLTIFLGLEQAFILSDYSQGYVACAWGLYNVSLVFICFGVLSAISAFLTGRLSKYIPRLIIILTGATGNVIACAIMFLWQPDNKNFIYFFIITGLWGLSDGIWQTEMNSMYGIFFRKDEEAAYGNLRLWEAVGFFIPYFCNKRLCMSSKLYLVLAVLATGLLGYIAVEILAFIKRSCVQPKK